MIWQKSSQVKSYFISLPVELSSEIHQHSKWQEEGWEELKRAQKLEKQIGKYQFVMIKNRKLI